MAWLGRCCEEAEASAQCPSANALPPCREPWMVLAKLGVGRVDLSPSSASFDGARERIQDGK